MKTSVALAKCAQYRPEDIAAALDKLFATLGGPAKFIPRNGSILIKPNLLTDRSPDKAVTTHPEIARAVIRMVRQCGGKPFIGDSPAGMLKIDSVLDKTGFGALCAEEQVKFVVFEQEPCVARDYNGVPLAIAKAAFDADLIINLPKLKTHAFTLFTNAVKNVFGLLPGYQKALLHKTFAHPDQFGDCLAFLYGAVRPGLTICDAITAMEGDGPSGGTPVQIGLLAASSDGVALDTVMCRLLKINPGDVGYLNSLRRSGVGESRLENIELSGDHLESAGLRPLKLPLTAKAARLIPRRLARIIGPYVWIAPSFKESCTACGRCAQACPVKALEIRKNPPPLLNRRKCIACCCCHEICPERAIEMISSPLLSFISGRRSRG